MCLVLVIVEIIVPDIVAGLGNPLLGEQPSMAFNQVIGRERFEYRSADFVDVAGSDLLAVSARKDRAPHMLAKRCAFFVARAIIDPALDASPTGELILVGHRSEERRVGKACFSTCRSRWLPFN